MELFHPESLRQRKIPVAKPGKEGRTDAVLIFNPTAGPRDTRQELERVIEYLSARGWQAVLRVTRKPGDAKQLAEAVAAAGCQAVFVAGGDGTVNEVVNGLVGSSTAMGVLPVGTGNVWAKELRLPMLTLAHRDRLVVAARMLLEGEVRAVDVGRAGDRCFLVCAGIGIDAQVAAEVEPRTRSAKQMGALPYLMAGLMVARDFSGVRTTVVIDGRTIRAKTILVLVSNIQLYGGLVRITPEARLDDGQLDVRIFRGMGPSWVLRHTAGVFINRHLRDPKVTYHRGRRVTVYTADPCPIQLDGEPVGTTPMSIEVVPRALRVLVPRKAPADLFCRPEIGHPVLPPPTPTRWSRAWEKLTQLRPPWSDPHDES